MQNKKDRPPEHTLREGDVIDVHRRAKSKPYVPEFRLVVDSVVTHEAGALRVSGRLMQPDGTPGRTRTLYLRTEEFTLVEVSAIGHQSGCREPADLDVPTSSEPPEGIPPETCEECESSGQNCPLHEVDLEADPIDQDGALTTLMERHPGLDPTAPGAPQRIHGDERDARLLLDRGSHVTVTLDPSGPEAGEDYLIIRGTLVGVEIVLTVLRDLAPDVPVGYVPCPRCGISYAAQEARAGLAQCEGCDAEDAAMRPEPTRAERYADLLEALAARIRAAGDIPMPTHQIAAAGALASAEEVRQVAEALGGTYVEPVPARHRAVVRLGGAADDRSPALLLTLSHVEPDALAAAVARYSYAGNVQVGGESR